MTHAGALNQSVSQPASQPVSQSVSQPASQPASQSLSQPVIQWTECSKCILMQRQQSQHNENTHNTLKINTIRITEAHTDHTLAHTPSEPVRGEAGQPRVPTQRRPSETAPSGQIDPTRIARARGLRSLAARERRRMQRSQKRNIARQEHRRNKTCKHPEGLAPAQEPSGDGRKNEFASDFKK